MKTIFFPRQKLLLTIYEFVLNLMKVLNLRRTRKNRKLRQKKIRGKWRKIRGKILFQISLMRLTDFISSMTWKKKFLLFTLIFSKSSVELIPRISLFLHASTSSKSTYLEVKWLVMWFFLGGFGSCF